MAYTVTVLFDHMLEDETHYFENESDALKCKSWSGGEVSRSAVV